MPDSVSAEILHQWTFPEFEHRNHSVFWKIAMTSILLGGVGASLWYRNFTFAFLLAIVGIILALRESRGPELMRVRLSEVALELLFDDHHYRELPPTTVIPWKEIQSFWIVYRPPKAKNIYFHFHSPFRQRLRIPLEHQNPIDVRETLLQFIIEDTKKTSEPFVEILARRMKF